MAKHVFPKGNKLGPGGKKGNKGGRPSKAVLDAREAKLTVWEREIKKQEEKLAALYVKRALKSDRVLLDLRRTRLADAKQELSVEHKGKISSSVVIETVDPHGVREK